MKARVVVLLKEGVLDPQGETVRRSLNRMGRKEIRGVRQGKFFEIEFAEGTGSEEARAVTEQIARDVLSNPIIESFEIKEIH